MMPIPRARLPKTLTDVYPSLEGNLYLDKIINLEVDRK